MGYKRSVEEKEKLQKLYEQTKNTYGNGAYYDEQKHRIIKYWAAGPGTGKWLRRLGNKRLRHLGRAYKGGEYRKVFDYWWELF